MKNFARILSIILAILTALSCLALVSCNEKDEDDEDDKKSGSSYDGVYDINTGSEASEKLEIKGNKVTLSGGDVIDSEEMISELGLEEGTDAQMIEKMVYTGTCKEDGDGVIIAEFTELKIGHVFEGKDAEKAKKAYVEYLEGVLAFAEDDPETASMVNAMLKSIKEDKFLDYKDVFDEIPPEITATIKLDTKKKTAILTSTVDVFKDENGKIVSKTESKYDENGNEIESKEYDENGELTEVTKMEYYPNGELKKRTHYDAEGNVTSSWEYDENGDVIW